VRRFGRDYARTLQLWRERFDAATPALESLGFDKGFRRKWRLYFCYCEAAFLDGAIDVGIYRLTKIAGSVAARPANPSEQAMQKDT
jgi:cyclopropane-fatty-acyl-phospholipid synthase